MNALGYKYEHGTGIAVDIKKAVNWYCMAVLRGNPRAMNNLATMLDDGKLLPRNTSDARGLWRQSAATGDLNAMVGLGMSLLKGPGLSLDPDEGRRWILMAARNGQPYAEQLARQMGMAEPFPPPVDREAQMRLQPADAPPGHAETCGETVS